LYGRSKEKAKDRMAISIYYKQKKCAPGYGFPGALL
jgi:hypothetical protein